MLTEFYITKFPEWYTKFVLKKILRKEILCTAIAKRNLCGSKVNIFGQEFQVPVSIQKNDKFFVIRAMDTEYNAIKLCFFGSRTAVYQVEDIFCQTKWKGQPYEFFFKDISVAS